MTNLFECKVSYDKMQDNGTIKRVTEPYLVDALSFTEAEARITDELLPYISGEYQIADIKRTRYAEVFTSPKGDRYYRAKILFITLDEKSGTEKKTAAAMLVQASDIKDALGGIAKGMEGTLADYEIASISETQILEVFFYGDMQQVQKPSSRLQGGQNKSRSERQYNYV